MVSIVTVSPKCTMTLAGSWESKKPQVIVSGEAAR
jgi:hypothetical protein